MKHRDLMQLPLTAAEEVERRRLEDSIAASARSLERWLRTEAGRRWKRELPKLRFVETRGEGE